MEIIERNAGWLVSVWCWVIGHLPTANQCLVYVSIAVGIAQIAYTCQRIRRGGRNK